jgi:integrase
MATLIVEDDGRWRIQFKAADETRKGIRLGKMKARDAERFKRMVEQIRDAQRGIGTWDNEMVAWRDALEDGLYKKFVKVGLLDPKVKPVEETPAAVVTLAEFISGFVARQTSAKPNTLANLKQVEQWLQRYFGEGRDIQTIAPADADDFKAFMVKNGLGENTARRHIGRCRQIFKSAIRRKVYREVNPFEGIQATVRSNKKRQFNVTREMTAAVIDACPDAQWRLLVALARYGGVRMPSEALPLTWEDINWEKGTILIHSPKTEHHEGHETRLIPLFPELREPLEDVRALAGDYAQGDFVITRYRAKGANLRTQLHRIIRKAGLQPWPKPWHNMRSTRETELSEKFPIQLVTAWIGNTPKVALESYLQVTDADFARASAEVVQNPVQQQSEVSGSDQRTKNSESENHSEISENPSDFALASYPRQESNL